MTLDRNYSSGYCSGFSPDSLSNNPNELFYYYRVRRYKFLRSKKQELGGQFKLYDSDKHQKR